MFHISYFKFNWIYRTRDENITKRNGIIKQKMLFFFRICKYCCGTRRIAQAAHVVNFAKLFPRAAYDAAARFINHLYVGEKLNF